MSGSDSFWSSESVWFYVSLILGAILIFQAGIWYGNYKQSNSVTTLSQAQTSTEAPSTNQPRGSNDTNNSESAPVEQPLPDRPSWLKELQTHPDKKALGNPDAPVTITEYLDFECPFCQRYNRNTFPKILKNYIQSGQVYYRIRHFPLPMHENAVPAGNAAECAADQGKFWAFKYVVMNMDRELRDPNLLKVGSHIGIPDMDQYQECVKNASRKSIVQDENQDGRSKGVSATPTVFVGETKIEGAQPYKQYQQAIDDVQ